jgi:hypothetical protein
MRAAFVWLLGGLAPRQATLPGSGRRPPRSRTSTPRHELHVRPARCPVLAPVRRDRALDGDAGAVGGHWDGYGTAMGGYGLAGFRACMCVKEALHRSGILPARLHLLVAGFYACMPA